MLDDLSPEARELLTRIYNSWTDRGRPTEWNFPRRPDNRVAVDELIDAGILKKDFGGRTASLTAHGRNLCRQLASEHQGDDEDSRAR